MAYCGEQDLPCPCSATIDSGQNGASECLPGTPEEFVPVCTGLLSAFSLGQQAPLTSQPVTILC